MEGLEVEYGGKRRIEGRLQVPLASTTEYLLFPLPQTGKTPGADQGCKGEAGGAKSIIQ